MEHVKNLVFSFPNTLRGLLILVVGLVLIGWLFNTPPGLLGKSDAIGYAVCHRIDARSFHIGDRQIPLCARCSGMYLGAMFGLGFLFLSANRKSGSPPKPIIFILSLFVLAFFVDGINSFVHLFPGSHSVYEPQNWLRLATGTGMGLVIAVALFSAFNQAIWMEWDRRPAIKDWTPFILLIVLAFFVDLLVLTENPFVLYPISLISAGGVLVLLTIIYTMLCMAILRIENSITQRMQLLFPLTAGFGLAITQILLLDLLRFAITGSWDGFHLG